MTRVFRSPNITSVLSVAVGASFVLETVIMNTSLTLMPAISVAVTLALIVPISPFSGVPERTPDEVSKESQLGSEFPFSSVAEYVKTSSSSLFAASPLN